MINEKNKIKKIFIAGANGMVGSAIKRAYMKKMAKSEKTIKLLTQ